MTGEITLRGQVLPIGGLKEKALAAQRNGIRTVIAPKLNEQDVDEIPEHLRADLDFVFVEEIAEVFDVALEDARRDGKVTRARPPLSTPGRLAERKAARTLELTVPLPFVLIVTTDALSRPLLAAGQGRVCSPRTQPLLEEIYGSSTEKGEEGRRRLRGCAEQSVCPAHHGRPQLREDIGNAIATTRKAYTRLSNGKAPTKALMEDKKLQKQLREAAASLRDVGVQLREGPKRKRKCRIGRKLLLLAVGAGGAGAQRGLRKKVLDALFGLRRSSTTPPRPPRLPRRRPRAPRPSHRPEASLEGAPRAPFISPAWSPSISSSASAGATPPGNRGESESER